MIDIEGIEHHSSKRKKGRDFKLWMLPAVFFVVIVYYYFSDEQMPKKSNTNLIVVKEPESDKAKIISIPVNIETTTSNPRPEEPKVLESLDEVNQNYRK